MLVYPSRCKSTLDKLEYRYSYYWYAREDVSLSLFWTVVIFCILLGLKLAKTWR